MHKPTQLATTKTDPIGLMIDRKDTRKNRPVGTKFFRLIRSTHRESTSNRSSPTLTSPQLTVKEMASHFNSSRWIF
jgi:hypothetical protein